MKKVARKNNWSTNKSCYLILTLTICFLFKIEILAAEKLNEFLNMKNIYYKKHLLVNGSLSDKPDNGNHSTITLTTQRPKYLKAPKNLAARVFWDPNYSSFRINLTWIAPPDLQYAEKYYLQYDCDPSPCKKLNHFGNHESFDISKTSITLPIFETNPNATDFVSLDSTIVFTLKTKSFKLGHSENASLSIYVPECVDDRCDCKHMSTLPSVNLTAVSDLLGKVKVMWSLADGILDRKHHKYEFIRFHIMLWETFQNHKKLIESERILNSDHNKSKYQSFKFKMKLNLESRYRVSLFMEDRDGCTSKNFTSIVIHDVTRASLDNTAYIAGGCFLLIILVCSYVMKNRAWFKQMLSNNSSSSEFPIPTINTDGSIVLTKIYRPNVPLRPSPGYLGQSAEVFQPRNISNDPFEIDMRRLKFIKTIGQGEFGHVYKAFLTSKDFTQQSIVAVKTLKDNPIPGEVNEFIKEIKIFKEVGEHPNIVQLLGYSMTADPSYMVMEFLSNGDLAQYLRRLKSNFLQNPVSKSKTTRFGFSPDELNLQYNTGSIRSIESESSVPTIFRPSVSDTEYILLSSDGSPMTPDSIFPEHILDPLELQRFALQIARGMRHLETKNVVHRDLAARNILIDDNRNLKISDFGLSRTGTYICTKSKLPFRWLSLEAIKHRRFTNKSDVWSYGVVLWEIGTLGEIPYTDKDDFLEICKFLSDGHRLDQPECLSDDIYALLVRCWSERPDDRPDFAELVQILETLTERKMYITFDNLISLSNPVTPKYIPEEEEEELLA